MIIQEFNTPILLIAWRRPNHLLRVIESLRLIRAKYLYIVVDGPRAGDDYKSERELINETKKVIELNIDWDCHLIKVYRAENLGCARGVSEAITWFFEFVEEGIILEDDVLLTTGGFKFLEWGLEKFKDNDNIWILSAWNPYNTFGLSIIHDYFHCWGWATWRSVWNNYTLEISELNIKYSNLSAINAYWRKIFQNLRKIDTWDYQMQYWMFKNNAKAVLAPRNYVNNIGFDMLGVHTNFSKPDDLNIDTYNNFSKPITIKLIKLVSDILDYNILRKPKSRLIGLKGIFYWLIKKIVKR